MPRHPSLPPTGTASFLVIRYWLLVFVFSKVFQLKIVTKKIEWMAGKWKPKKPSDSVQEIKKLEN
jgi:hypothetical protein